MSKTNHEYELELKQAIANLYKVFAYYPLNHQIAGCPCCVTEKDRQSLLSKRLDKLTADDMNHFAFKAMTTWGTVRDFKHFLPRLFELAAFNNQFFWSDVVIRKLSYAKIHTWQEEEQQAVERYLLALWNYILSQYPYPLIQPDEFINSSIEITQSLNIFLVMWENHSSINSLLHLSNLITNEIQWHESPLSIMHLSEQQIEKFLYWLTRKEIIAKLDDFCLENLNKTYAANLAIAVDILNTMNCHKK